MDCRNTLQVGNTGSGQLVITGGGSVAAGSLIVATRTAAVGEVSMAGAGTGLSVAGTLTVGDAGLGTLDITSGATATAIALIVAAQSTSGTATRPDMVTVDGTGSMLTISGSTTVDTAVPTATNGSGDPDGTDGVWSYTNSGFGQIVVSNGGYVSIGQTLTLQAPTGPTVPAILTIASGGGVEVGGNSGLAANTLQVDANGRISGHGQITGTVTGEVPVSDSTTAPTYSLNIDNDGAIEASNGTLVLDGNLSGDGQVLVGQDSTLEFGGTVAEDVTAMFLPSGDGTSGDATIAIDDPQNFQGVISSENFEPGDAIDLPNVPYIDPGSADLNPDGASFYFETGEQQQNYVLQVVEDDQTYNIPINQDAPLSGGFTLSDDGHGDTLVTYTDEPVTGYSVTATADGNPLTSYKGVVNIISSGPNARNFAGVFAGGVGSGFAVGQSLILTAMHAVAAGVQTRGYIDVYVPNDNGPGYHPVKGYLGAHGEKRDVRRWGLDGGPRFEGLGLCLCSSGQFFRAGCVYVRQQL